MAFEEMGTVVNNQQGHELSWDDEVTEEAGGPQYVVLPKGDYKFMVETFDRGRYEPKPGSKIPACNKAVLHILLYKNVMDQEPCAQARYNLYLHSTQERSLASFFMAIGQKKAGQTFRMKWNEVPGSVGYCHCEPREYNGKNYNDVKWFLDPANLPDSIKSQIKPAVPTPHDFKAGQF